MPKYKLFLVEKTGLFLSEEEQFEYSKRLLESRLVNKELIELRKTGNLLATETYEVRDSSDRVLFTIGLEEIESIDGARLQTQLFIICDEDKLKSILEKITSSFTNAALFANIETDPSDFTCLNVNLSSIHDHVIPVLWDILRSEIDLPEHLITTFNQTRYPLVIDSSVRSACVALIERFGNDSDAQKLLDHARALQERTFDYIAFAKAVVARGKPQLAELKPVVSQATGPAPVVFRVHCYARHDHSPVSHDSDSATTSDSDSYQRGRKRSRSQSMASYESTGSRSPASGPMRPASEGCAVSASGAVLRMSRLSLT